MTWSHQIKLTCGRRFERLHPYPAFGGGAQEAETLLPVGSLDQRTYRFGHLRSVGTGKVLEDGDGDRSAVEDQRQLARLGRRRRVDLLQDEHVRPPSNSQSTQMVSPS